MNVATTELRQWMVSARGRGEVLTTSVRGPGIEVVLLGAPASFDADELEAWLRDLVAVSRETAAGDTGARPIPALLHHLLTGLLFSHAELWSRSKQTAPLSMAFVRTPQQVAFGWVGETTPDLWLDDQHVTVEWVRIRDQAGNEARSLAIDSRHRVRLHMGLDIPFGTQPIAASVDAAWVPESDPDPTPVAVVSPPQALADQPTSPPGAAAPGETPAEPSGSDWTVVYDGESAPEEAGAESRQHRPSGNWWHRITGWLTRRQRPRPAADVTRETPDAGAISEWSEEQIAAGSLPDQVPPSPEPAELTARTVEPTPLPVIEALTPAPVEPEALAPPVAPAVTVPQVPAPLAAPSAPLAAPSAPLAATSAPLAATSAPLAAPSTPPVGSLSDFRLEGVTPWEPSSQTVGPPPLPGSITARNPSMFVPRSTGPAPLSPAPAVQPQPSATPVAIPPAESGPMAPPPAPPAYVPQGKVTVRSSPSRPQAPAAPRVPANVAPAAPAVQPSPIATAPIASAPPPAPPPAASIPPPVPTANLVPVEPLVEPMELSPADLAPASEPPMATDPLAEPAFETRRTPPRPRTRVPLHPEWPAAEPPRVVRPWWSRPWAWGALVVLLFLIGWMVGGIQTDREVGESNAFSHLLRAVGLGGARYEVEVSSHPPGAWIAVDGKDLVRRTPATLEVAPGTHTVSLSFADLGSASFTVKGMRGDHVPLEARLWGSLSVYSGDSSIPVAVTVDGTPRGLAPVTVDSMMPGAHDLHFSGPGLQSWGQTVQVRVNETAQVVARPMSSPATGVIDVRASWTDAEGSEDLNGANVYVDGEHRGVTPLTLELPRGPHSVRVESRGEQSLVQVIDLPGGNQRFAKFELGLAADRPRLQVLGLPLRLSPDQTTVLSANLDGVTPGEVRDMWLHVRQPEGTWRRYEMTTMKSPGGVVGSAVFPITLLDDQGRTLFYVSSSTTTGDEFFSEILPALQATPTPKK